MLLTHFSNIWLSSCASQFLEGCTVGDFKVTILTSKQPQFFKFDKSVELCNMELNWHVKFVNLMSTPWLK